MWEGGCATAAALTVWESAMLVPDFFKLWDAFPTHNAYPTMGSLYGKLGGGAAVAIEWEGFGEHGNTCASRLSVALNEGGYPIHASVCANLDISTLKAADSSHIIFRVRDFRRYLFELYGRPDLDDVPPCDDLFLGQRGIVAFKVQGWTDATGHIALYDGASYREAEHDDVPLIYPNVTIVHTEFWQLS